MRQACARGPPCWTGPRHPADSGVLRGASRLTAGYTQPSLPSGYYYDLDDSYDESDEEEVRAHLRCVAEQPPLKLDTCSEVSRLPVPEACGWPCPSPAAQHGWPRAPAVVEASSHQGFQTHLFSFPIQKLEFLQLFGLTTQQQKEELVAQKRRKRRRMLRERSPSPPPLQSKRQTPSPRLVLSTRYSPEDMNNSPNLEEKKKFLTIFNLTHVSTEKRKGNGLAWRCRAGRWGLLLGLREKQAGAGLTWPTWSPSSPGLGGLKG